MKRAVCIQCGEDRATFDETCPACGHRPEGDARLVAWLLSDQHLTTEQLDQVQRRIRAGEAIRPSKESLETARRAMGAHYSTDEGLTMQQRLGLLAVSVFLTPLVGWVYAAWWRRERPRAAVQALALSLPFSVLFFFLAFYLESRWRASLGM